MPDQPLIAELIEAALREHFPLRLTRSAIEDAQRGWPVRLSGAQRQDIARIAVEALKGAGLVVAPAEDLDDATDALAERESVCSGSDCSDVYCQRVIRLRAALSERNDHGPERP